MPKLKNLSGKEVIKIFLSFGFEVASQTKKEATLNCAEFYRINPSRL